MKHLFLYNWKVREEWMDALFHLPHEELVRTRVGGVGSILHTLFHIVDVEYSWFQVLMGEEVSEPDFEDYKSLELIRNLSTQYQKHLVGYINNMSNDRDNEIVTASWSGEQYYYGEVLRHLIAHEIHHIGQLSVWAKEIGIQVVSSNFIGRGLMEEMKEDK